MFIRTANDEELREMNNDVIVLLRQMKAAAEKATQGEWHKGRQDPVTGIIKIYARTGITKLNCIVKTDAHEVGFGISEREHKANAELIALVNPANIQLFVEAMEARDKRIAELESRPFQVTLAKDKPAESEVSDFDNGEFYRAGWNDRGKADTEVLGDYGINVKVE
ncbi:TPA: ead/Ea22-like family protein [Salmonella enterica subsp. diarizonae serovar 61:l,v:z35]